MKRRGISKELAAMLDECQRQGCEVRLTPGGHIRVKTPGRRGLVFGPQTPSDHRSLKNFRSQLRRAGITLR